MSSSQRFKTLLHLKGIIRISPPTPESHPIYRNFPSIFSPNYSTVTSGRYSFTVSYLINKCGFSLEAALIASKQVRFKDSRKPDSVLAFFGEHGFSDSQINSIIRRAPNLLTCNIHQRVLPKFEFLVSKGASSSEILRVVNRNPRFLYPSLEHFTIPLYELVRRFLKSDEKAINLMISFPLILSNNNVTSNVKLLLAEGVADSNIAYLLLRRPSTLAEARFDFRKAVEEVKELGFDPSKSSFIVALLAKLTVPKTQWDSKVDAFKSWGWSEEAILEAFRRQPSCMLASKDKIDEVMSFLVGQLGWNPLAPIKRPGIFGYSLARTIIPRAFVVQYLLAKGLRNKNANLFTPFYISEKKFLDKYVRCYNGESSQLLKLYQEKMNLKDNREDVSSQQLSNG